MIVRLIVAAIKITLKFQTRLQMQIRTHVNDSENAKDSHSRQLTEKNLSKKDSAERKTKKEPENVKPKMRIAIQSSSQKTPFLITHLFHCLF